MSVFVDLTGLDRLWKKVNKLGRLDATPLMATWMDIISDDNRKGVLAGLDKDGNPMAPVTYRPKGPTVGIGAKSASRFRNNAKGRSKAGTFAGIGSHAAGLNNNLLRREYEQLTGPPLAPRRQFSRVITNLVTMYDESSDGKTWHAYGFWDEVVDVKGRPFLQYHFQGRGGGSGGSGGIFGGFLRRASRGFFGGGGRGGRTKKRDLTGVRPVGREKARKAAIAWMSAEIRAAGSTSNAP